MSKLVLLRHGTSQWNIENRFTGWVDVDLAEQGIKEAHRAADLIKKAGIAFDIAYASYLKRARKTLDLVLQDLGETGLPQKSDWRLNERHYGALQGLNKSETAAKYGEDQVKLWRRSYKTQPPMLDPSDEMAPRNQPQYKDIDPDILPLGESLQDVEKRVMPLWNEEILPLLKNGKNVIVALSGNSCRAIVKNLDAISDDAINDLNIPTAQPLVYEFDGSGNPVKHYYLAPQSEIDAQIEAVKQQGKAK